MLTITRRAAKIGTSLNVRNELHGDEDVPACDIPIDGIMLEAEELNALLDNPEAHQRLFISKTHGFEEPAIPQFGSHRMADKFEGARVKLHLGVKPTLLELEDVKLAKVTLEPKPGGMTAMSLQVQATPGTKAIGQISAFMNHEISIEITDAARAKKSAKQDELPLSMGNGKDDRVTDARRRKVREYQASTNQTADVYQANAALMRAKPNRSNGSKRARKPKSERAEA